MHATRRTWRHCVDIHVRSGADSGMCLAFITFSDADECGQCFQMIWDHWWAHVANGFFRKLSFAPHEQRTCNAFRKVVNVYASVGPMEFQHARLGHWTEGNLASAWSSSSEANASENSGPDATAQRSLAAIVASENTKVRTPFELIPCSTDVRPLNCCSFHEEPSLQLLLAIVCDRDIRRPRWCGHCLRYSHGEAMTAKLPLLSFGTSAVTLL